MEDEKNRLLVLEQIRTAFSKRSLSSNPSILESKEHTDFPDVQVLFEVDWDNPLPQALSKCANAIPLLTPKGFAFVFGKFLETTLTHCCEMMGNEITNVLLMDLLSPPNEFANTIVSRKITDLSTEEIKSIHSWSYWFEKSEYKKSISQIEKKSMWLRENIGYSGE